jgi:replicative DNA helicase
VEPLKDQIEETGVTGLAEMDLEELVSYYEKSLSPSAISFLKRKGIEMETAEKYHIGFEGPKIGFNASQSKLGGYFTNHLVFPIYNEAGEIVDLLGQPIQDIKPHNKMLLGKTTIFFNQGIIEKASFMPSKT